MRAPNSNEFRKKAIKNKEIREKVEKSGRDRGIYIMDYISTDGFAERSDRLFAESLVLACGIPVHLKGFDLLVDCALAYSISPLPFSELYSFVGALHSMTGHTVTRDVSHALRRTTDLHIRLSELSGVPVSDNDTYNRFVITLLSKLIRRNRFFN